MIRQIPERQLLGPMVLRSMRRLRELSARRKTPQDNRSWRAAGRTCREALRAFRGGDSRGGIHYPILCLFRERRCAKSGQRGRLARTSAEPAFVFLAEAETPVVDAPIEGKDAVQVIDPVLPDLLHRRKASRGWDSPA
jgi:hypothetical protein